MDFFKGLVGGKKDEVPTLEVVPPNLSETLAPQVLPFPKITDRILETSGGPPRKPELFSYEVESVTQLDNFEGVRLEASFEGRDMMVQHTVHLGNGKEPPLYQWFIQMAKDASSFVSRVSTTGTTFARFTTPISSTSTFARTLAFTMQAANDPEQASVFQMEVEETQMGKTFGCKLSAPLQSEFYYSQYISKGLTLGVQTMLDVVSARTMLNGFAKLQNQQTNSYLSLAFNPSVFYNLAYICALNPSTHFATKYSARFNPNQNSWMTDVTWGVNVAYSNANFKGTIDNSSKLTVIYDEKLTNTFKTSICMESDIKKSSLKVGMAFEYGDSFYANPEPEQPLASS